MSGSRRYGLQPGEREFGLPCPFCDNTYLNADTIIQHCARDHDPKLNTVEAVYGNTCPACGKPFERLGYHTTRTHRRQLPLLWADMLQAGDPYGVVTSRLRRFANDWLEARGVGRGLRDQLTDVENARLMADVDADLRG